MGSQNWWFGDSRPLVYTSKPLYTRVQWFLGHNYLKNTAKFSGPGDLQRQKAKGAAKLDRLCRLQFAILCKYQTWSKKDMTWWLWRIPSWWFQIFFIFIPILGERIHFDEHIFQMVEGVDSFVESWLILIGKFLGDFLVFKRKPWTLQWMVGENSVAPIRLGIVILTTRAM